MDKNTQKVYENYLLSFWGDGDQEELLKRMDFGASLVVQWLRIHLPMQGTQVPAQVWEDPTCRGATKPMRHNY